MPSFSASKVFAFAGLVFFLLGSTQAAATYCSVYGSPNADGMKLGDVTFSGNAPSNAADDCYGITTGLKDTAPDINGLGLEWGTDWQFLITDTPDGAGSPGSFGGITYSLSSGSGPTMGIWSLMATPTAPATLAAYVDFIVSLKSGNEDALWLFDDVQVDGNDSGSWNSVFETNSNGGLKNVTHMTLFVRQGTDPDAPVAPSEIPEPSALALVGLAALAATGARRRKARG